ncbi:cytosolic sulfotransferase 12-like [Sesamum indicum]|uniref:Sulfotransferase n=1 Tax=Sesamum indicum TaxID=4182 RepID=A0A6I9T7J1_SESIN|nr:cytosolic sulfotransferase 12-like [Sesamum indicum]
MEDSSFDLELELSSLPREKWWADDYLYQLGGFWFLPQSIEGVIRVNKNFRPLPSDVILASFPKTGTTWLKALLYSIVNPSSKHRLTVENPHSLVPFLEYFDSYGKPPYESTTVVSPDANHCRRIFSTHMPYQLLERTLDSSDCRVVYVTRNPKDTLVSTWHFVNKWEKAREEPWPFEVAVEKFCCGVTPYGPYDDHVMGYRKLSLKRPKNAHFLTYEELKNDPETHVKNLAEFLGCPFEGEDVEGQVREIVKSCSFEVLSSHEVNKSEDVLPGIPLNLTLNSFFRNGVVGGYKDHLSDEIVEKIDALTREKFHSLGFMYGI